MTSTSCSLESIFIVLIILLVVSQGYYLSGQRHFTVRWSNQHSRHTNIQYTYIYPNILLHKPHHQHLVRDPYLAGRGISPSDGLSSQTNNAYQLNNNYDRWPNLIRRRISAPVQKLIFPRFPFMSRPPQFVPGGSQVSHRERKNGREKKQFVPGGSQVSRLPKTIFPPLSTSPHSSP